MLGMLEKGTESICGRQICGRSIFCGDVKKSVDN